MTDQERTNTPEEEALISDMVRHVVDQCRAAIQRGRELLPFHLRHQLSLTVVASLTAIPYADVMKLYKQVKHPDAEALTFEYTLDAVLGRIRELALKSDAARVMREEGITK